MFTIKKAYAKVTHFVDHRVSSRSKDTTATGMATSVVLSPLDFPAGRDRIYKIMVQQVKVIQQV